MRLLAAVLLLALPVAAQEREVLVLGRTQLLADARAFDAFCRANAKTQRSKLRADVVARLRKIAADEQPAILESTAEDLPPKGKDNRTGAGLVNATAAVEAAK